MPTYYPTHPAVGHKKTSATDKIAKAIVDSYGNVGNEFNTTAVEDNFFHLIMPEPEAVAEPVAATATAPAMTMIAAYEPLDADLLKLPKKDATPLGPAAACATNCQAQYQLRQTQCDILRERVAQALRDGHCPSLIKAVSEFNPCGGVTTTTTSPVAPSGCASGTCQSS